MTIAGRIMRGRGTAAGFTRLDWVVRQTLAHVGIDPFPGTLNIKLTDPLAIDAWAKLRASAGHRIDPPVGSGFCSAQCYPVAIDSTPAAAIVPDVPGYPADTVELVAAVGMREHLGLAEHAPVTLRASAPFEVRAVMFDVDGTLLDSVPAYFEIARLAAEPHGYAVTMADIRHSLATAQSFWRGVVPEDEPDREQRIKQMSALARHEWPRVLRERARPFPEVDSLIAELHRRGIKLGIVTAAHGEVVELLREHGLVDPFAAIVTGTDVTRRKPDPEGLLKCLALLGVPAGEALYVGDTPLDIDAARAAGMHSLGVLTGAADSAMLTRCGAGRLLPNLEALSGLILDPDARAGR